MDGRRIQAWDQEEIEKTLTKSVQNSFQPSTAPKPTGVRVMHFKGFPAGGAVGVLMNVTSTNNPNPASVVSVPLAEEDQFAVAVSGDSIRHRAAAVNAATGPNQPQTTETAFSLGELDLGPLGKPFCLLHRYNYDDTPRDCQLGGLTLRKLAGRPAVLVFWRSASLVSMTTLANLHRGFTQPGAELPCPEWIAWKLRAGSWRLWELDFNSMRAWQNAETYPAHNAMALVYCGETMGLDEPSASIRLKGLRRGSQDRSIFGCSRGRRRATMADAAVNAFCTRALVAGKDLAGLIVALVLFVDSTALCFTLMGKHFGPAWTEYLLHGPGLRQLGACSWRHSPASATARCF